MRKNENFICFAKGNFAEIQKELAALTKLCFYCGVEPTVSNANKLIQEVRNGRI